MLRAMTLDPFPANATLASSRELPAHYMRDGGRRTSEPIIWRKFEPIWE
jgi:hypothetical protein